MTIHEKLGLKRLDHTATLEELARLVREVDALVGGPGYAEKKAGLTARIHTERQTAVRLEREIHQLTQSLQPQLL